jgi:hypothetical protein
MKTLSVPSSEVQAAGGLAKWMLQESRKTRAGLASGRGKPKATQNESGAILGRDSRMNKWEARYAERLRGTQAAGEIVAFDFEAMKFNLGFRCWYCPDFVVTLPDGRIECHEVKGFMRDDAAVKIKTAARRFPSFRFRLARIVKGAWVVTEVPR